MEGYSDGTFQATGEKFFACSYGRGLYYPLNNLKLDKRCPPGMATNGQLGMNYTIVSFKKTHL